MARFAARGPSLKCLCIRNRSSIDWDLKFDAIVLFVNTDPNKCSCKDVMLKSHFELLSNHYDPGNNFKRRKILIIWFLSSAEAVPFAACIWVRCRGESPPSSTFCYGESPPQTTFPHLKMKSRVLDFKNKLFMENHLLHQHSPIEKKMKGQDLDFKGHICVAIHVFILFRQFHLNCRTWRTKPQQ